ncbi:hypothetical protein BH09PAT3_BH09PAT3_5540 [soil metagenome]
MITILDTSADWVKRFIKQRPELSLVIATIVAIVLFVGASLYANVLIYDYITGATGAATGLGTNQNVIDTLVRYDSNHYIAIARDGYATPVSAAFLPLYPLLIRFVHSLTQLSYGWSALLVSWVALCAAVVVLYRWLKFELGKIGSKVSPWLAIGLLAVFPTSLYFALAYTESLFLLVNLGALLAFRKERYWLAAVLAGLAAVTRYQGLVLPLFFVGDFLLRKSSGYQYKKLLPVLGTIVGFSCYMIFLQRHYGNPLEFITAEQNWGRLHGNFISTIITTMRPDYLWFFVVLAVGLWGVWRHLGVVYAVYSAVFIFQPISSGSLDSINRYIVSLMPLFLVLAIIVAPKARQWLKTSYIVSATVLLAWSIALFANGYWVA